MMYLEDLTVGSAVKPPVSDLDPNNWRVTMANQFVCNLKAFLMLKLKSASYERIGHGSLGIIEAPVKDACQAS